MFHRLDRKDAAEYLKTRAGQGYTVVQAVALAELDGLTDPNAYGKLPLVSKDPTHPATTPGANPAKPAEYDYWDHVDYIVDEANRNGIYVGLLPTWGRWVVKNPRQDETIFTTASAQTYGEFLGKRYGRKGVIWILGGDRPSEGVEDIWRAMAKGIAIGVSGREDYDAVLMSFHPRGGGTSSTSFHNDAWLDVNMQQTGHGLADTVQSWAKIAKDYALTPAQAGDRRRASLRRPPARLPRQPERLQPRRPHTPASLLGSLLRRLRPHLREPRRLADVRSRPQAHQRTAHVLVRGDSSSRRR